MRLSKAPLYLFDVNVVVALLMEDHTHYRLVTEWFNATPDLGWAVCAFTETGFLRTVTAPRHSQITMSEATKILEKLKEHPGYRYLPITADWHTLCSPFYRRLYGTKQVTDAFLLGLAVHEGFILVTLDRALLHLAGEAYKSHVLVLS